jgi:hypothetical protein
MRREDREITDSSEIESILYNAIICRIGLGMKTGRFTFIQRLRGKKSRCLKKIPNTVLRLTSVTTFYVENVRMHGDAVPECHWF